MSIADVPMPRWTGRDDGPAPEHARWHQIVQPWQGGRGPCLIGFASDEGVRRNGGRVGAQEGPATLRAALGPLAAPRGLVSDAGDVVVADDDLEAGQERLSEVVRTVLDAGGLPIVLGGGHEVAYGSGTGLARARPVVRGARTAVINIDAHLDLRSAAQATSGTPFRQLADAARASGREFCYAALGISRANNTRALFDAAADLAVSILLDDECRPERIDALVAEVCARVDLVHLSIDLDVLPASVAPGVSAPAGFGIALDVVRHVCRSVAATGQLALLEVAELNPTYDIDGRTARTAARLIDDTLAVAWGGP